MDRFFLFCLKEYSIITRYFREIGNILQSRVNMWNFQLSAIFLPNPLFLPQKLQEGNLGFSATFNMLMRILPASRWAQETFCCNVTPFLAYIDWTSSTFYCCEFVNFLFTIITLLPFFIEMLQYDWLWSDHMIIKEMFHIPMKLKSELARASMTTSDVNNQWRSNFQ